MLVRAFWRVRKVTGTLKIPNLETLQTLFYLKQTMNCRWNNADNRLLKVSFGQWLIIVSIIIITMATNRLKMETSKKAICQLSSIKFTRHEGTRARKTA